LTSIDKLRGIAVMIMIVANSYPYFVPIEYCPPFLRVVFSSAAPVFIFLSGFSFRLAIENGKRSNALVKRALQVLFYAVIIDLCVWQIVPFSTMDVLYLISFSLLLTLMIVKLSEKVISIIVLTTIFSVFIIPDFYQFNLQEFTLGVQLPHHFFSQIVHHMLVDGWFPILPWTGFVLLGYFIAKHRLVLAKYKRYFLILGMSLILVYYMMIQLSYIPVNPLRDGYCEIFYPVQWPFLFFIFGIYSSIIFLVSTEWKGFSQISGVGKFSLPVYLIHVVLIKLFIPLFDQDKENFNMLLMLTGFLMLYLAVFCYLYILKRLLTLKQVKESGVLKFLLGC
jgi:uncharacterized membrane protein